MTNPTSLPTSSHLTQQAFTHRMTYQHILHLVGEKQFRILHLLKCVENCKKYSINNHKTKVNQVQQGACLKC